MPLSLSSCGTSVRTVTPPVQVTALRSLPRSASAVAEGKQSHDRRLEKRPLVGRQQVAVKGGKAIVWLSSAAMITRQGGGAEGPQMAEEVFKNVQILKGIPVDQFMGTMGMISAATGLNCTDCHLDESGGDWAKYADENARKQMARRMMRMVDAINQTSFGGRQMVTCFTCHRGSSRPSVMPSIDLLYSRPPPFEPGDLVGPARGPALGGPVARQVSASDRRRRAPKALKSFTAKGTYMGYDDAEKSPLEMYAQAPAKRTLTSHTP